MEIFYPADSARLPVETVSEINEQLFGYYDEWAEYNTDIDNEFETLSIISEEEFLQSELEF